MSVYSRLHYKALTDLVEMMSILSTLAIVVDLYWCLSDFVEQDYALRLVPVIIGLSVASVGMFFAIGKYHWKLVDQFITELRIDKVLRKHGREL